MIKNKPVHINESDCIYYQLSLIHWLCQTSVRPEQFLVLYLKNFTLLLCNLLSQKQYIGHRQSQLNWYTRSMSFQNTNFYIF